MPRDIPKEPPQTKERRVTLEENWPLPAVVVAHHITFDGDPDSYPLHIASKVLSDGQSSRIYRKLVYEKQLALAAFGGGNIIEDPNLFYAVAIVQPGHTTGGDDRRADRRARSAAQRADHRRPSCSRRRTSSRATTSSAASRTRTRPSQLGHAAVIHNDIKTADGEFDIFMNITQADVQRVARKYFTPENRLVMTIMPKGSTDGARRDDGASRGVPPAVRSLVAGRAGARRAVATGRRSGRRGRCRRATSSSRPTR